MPPFLSDLLMPRAQWVLALLGLGIVAASVLNILDNQRARAEVEGLRGRIRSARVAADSCRGELELQEERFHGFGASLESLRSEVSDFEALDPRGVPDARYQEYLSHFNAYNDSVKIWHARADSLKATQAACRALVEAHNALSDSLRRRVLGEESEGVREESGGG